MLEYPTKSYQQEDSHMKIPTYIPSNYSLEEILRIYEQNIPPILTDRILGKMYEMDMLAQEYGQVESELLDYQELVDSSNDLIELLEKRVELLEGTLGKHNIDIPSE